MRRKALCGGRDSGLCRIDGFVLIESLMCLDLPTRIELLHRFLPS